MILTKDGQIKNCFNPENIKLLFSMGWVEVAEEKEEVLDDAKNTTIKRK